MAILEVTVALLTLAYIGRVEASVECPAPRSPLNGQAFVFQHGRTVTYRCDPGFLLRGSNRAVCVDKEWSQPMPQCVSAGATPDDPIKQEKLTNPLPDRPLFNWGSESVNDSSSNSSMPQDEPRVHMVLYPGRHYPRGRVRTAAVRLQSSEELEKEEKRRSQEEKTTIRVQPPPVVYVRRAVTPGKVVVTDDALRQQYEMASIQLRVAEENPAPVTVVSVPRAAVSTDDKGGQSEESLRQMYVMAQDLYPRQAVIDPSNPVVVTLSESQMLWINSLHPELRDRYLKDLYTTRSKEAEEGARAQAFLRRYDDAYEHYYNNYYNRPYYVRQPVAVMVEDPVSSYDYTCYQADSNHRAVLVRAPQLPNARIYRYDRRSNPRHPYNNYLTAMYRCNPGYTLLDPNVSELHCRKRDWVGIYPRCVPTID